MYNFKVGDKVRAICNQYYGTNAKECKIECGYVGTVTHVSDFPSGSISVDGLMGEKGLPVFSPYAFVLVEGKPEALIPEVEVVKKKKSAWNNFDPKDKSLHGKSIMVVKEGFRPAVITPVDEYSYEDDDDEKQLYEYWNPTHWRKIPKLPDGTRYKD